MEAETPQLAAPFTINRQGVEVVEQDSEANVAGNVYNIAVCPRGTREELPSFGVPPTVNRYYPVDQETLEEALHEWEPEADLDLEQQRIAVGEAGITIAV